MRIFDCFLYNGEKEIVTLRFDLMGPYIDCFVIVEANETFSGIKKELFFKKDKHLWEKYNDKILFFNIIDLPKTDNAWEKEHFLRDQLRVKVPAEDNDLVIIADADEIVNVSDIQKTYPINEPTIIELPTYYYFFNVQSSEKIYHTLITPYKYIKTKNIGNRNTYKTFTKKVISSNVYNTGGHFTYIYGNEIEKYINKIKSFSHQEFNNDYFCNNKRIYSCVKFNLDIFDRRQFHYKTVNIDKEYPELYNIIINSSNLKNLLKTKSLNLKRFCNEHYLKFCLKKIRNLGAGIKSMILRK